MDIMERLKSETASLHQRAESHPGQKALLKGELPRAEYAEQLSQMLSIHRVLERRLRELSETDQRIASVVTEEQYQEPYLLQDLKVLDIDADQIDTMPNTTAMINTIRNASALGVLGMHYVLEGSNNGGKYIATAIAKAYGFVPGQPGLRYLDPYGADQRDNWTRFKDAMFACKFSDADSDELLAGARAMFNGLCGVFDDLGAARGLTASVG